MGSTFGALGCETVANMSSKIDAIIHIEKSSFLGRPSTKKCTGLVARRGVRGEVKLPLGVGGSKGRNTRRKEERKKARKEDLKKGRCPTLPDRVCRLISKKYFDVLVFFSSLRACSVSVATSGSFLDASKSIC